MFSKLLSMIRQAIARLFNYKDVETAMHIDTPLSIEMQTALDQWHDMYIGKAEWLKPTTVKSLGLPAFIASELARQIVLELKWNITGKGADGSTQDENGEDVMNPRAEFLKAEFDKCVAVLQQKLELGCAAGGMSIKPYHKNGHIYFDWTIDWGLFPIAFDDTGELSDVIFRDVYVDGKTTYTRLERHTSNGNSVHISQRAYKSQMRDNLGTEVPLSEVPAWKDLKPDLDITNTDGQLFGWYRVAAANNVDIDSPMGASVYAKAVGLIREADLQYSRLLWEYEGSELAIDVDPTVLRPKKDRDANGRTTYEMPQLNERLFRGVDMGADETYHVFSPAIRDVALVNGLNQILMRVEDECGLARGTLSDMNAEARTATELRIMRQRSYATISNNQAALERCLRDVIRVMDKYATIYGLAPEGEYEVSFQWDDSIITDTEQQMSERLLLLTNGVMSKEEFRQWYFGETKAQADAAIQAITAAQMAQAMSMLPTIEE